MNSSQMTAHFPTFSRSVQRRVEAYKRQLIGNIVRLRKEKGWAQKALAFHADVAQKTIERIEKGDFESTPRANTLHKIANALEVELSDIEPDVEAEEKELRDQLDRVEQKTLAILSQVSALAGRVEKALPQGRTATDSADEPPTIDSATNNSNAT